MKYMLPAVLALAASAAFAGDHFALLGLPAPSGASAANRSPELQPPWLGPNAAALEAAVAEAAEQSYIPNDANHAGLSLAASCPALPDEKPDEATCDTCEASTASDPHAGIVRPISVNVDSITASTAANGYRIADVFARRHELANQRVQVRGVVVKLTEGILDRTYLHLHDGSGSAATNDYDLTVTTREPCALGDVIELSGILLIEQDLGLGYAYPALLDDAHIVKAPQG